MIYSYRISEAGDTTVIMKHLSFSAGSFTEIIDYLRIKIFQIGRSEFRGNEGTCRKNKEILKQRLESPGSLGGRVEKKRRPLIEEHYFMPRPNP